MAVSLPGDPLSLLLLVFALGAVGWGFGLAAALARCSVWPAVHIAGRARALGVILAFALTLGASYAYALVLDAAGVIDYCDPVLDALRPC
jgi:hypothetical protein